MRPYLKKNLCKEGLVEWLKLKALSSNPSTAKEKKRNIKSSLISQALILDTYFLQ
jgi:hypothetical protein